MILSFIFFNTTFRPGNGAAGGCCHGHEGDIIDMGLGGALGALSLAGFIPAGGAVADVVKKGVKETAKDFDDIPSVEQREEMDRTQLPTKKNECYFF